MMYCDVYIEQGFLNNQTLTYSCGDFVVSFGMRVVVNVRGRRMIAFVSKVYPAVELEFKVQAIVDVVDEEAVLNTELFELATWMSYRTVSPIIRCLQTILPNKLKPKGSHGSIKMERMLQKTDVVIEGLTPLQSSFLDSFEKEIDYTSARKEYSGVRSLIDKGVLVEYSREFEYRNKVVEVTSHDLTLTAAQQEALDQILLDGFNTFLLHGVTGSGKTEIYLQKAREVLNNGKQVLIMVPEISLTPQMITRFSSRFGSDIAIYHSALNDQEKYEQYTRVQNGSVSIVVGTRSSVFMPFKDLGLIVVDEEHDMSYKQTNVPYYHARDVAKYRAKIHQCPLVLGSASPSLETYARALRGVYTLLELDERINLMFPEVTLIDTQEALKRRESSVLTNELIEGIQKRLDLKQQVVLLLNRRGYHTMLKNADTDAIMMCPNCDVALNYHKDGQSIRCHMCGYGVNHLPLIDGKRPKLVGSGMGTQKLSEYVQSVFPDARILRMDADTTRTKNSHEKILDSFINYEADILIGTQMIAKGLDIERVTLVGIVNADTSLAYTDYRSVETTFDLLLQASGRAGRGRHVGEVMIQTFNPDHYAIVYAMHHQYKSFFQKEMNYRKIAGYPPYNYLISIVFSHEDEARAFDASLSFKKLLMGDDFGIIGPTMLRKINRTHRSRIILKGKDLDGMLQSIHQTQTLYAAISRIGMVVDVNPLTLE